MSQHDALSAPQPDLSLVIVNYKTRDLLLALLESIYDGADDLRLECIVLDNASFDGSAQAVAARFPQVRFVQNNTNRYFSAAYTQGIQMAQGAHVLVLNPDMAVRGATLSQLLSALRADPSIGAATTTLYFPDGCLQRNGSRFTTFGYLVLNYTFLSKLYRWFLPRAWQALQDWLWYADWDRRTAREIDVLPGSAIIARRDVWRAAGYFDLRLKMYFSDDYFSRRMQALGLRTLYLPSDGILHYEGGSAKQVSARALTLYLRDLVVYTALVHGRIAAALLALLLVPTWLVQRLKAR
jgi:N-acetylglucosaminyl-diphospho-decaprenol L-rhamnosyltransferase